MPVYEMNAFINQYFLRNRFHDIYIFADQKYKETYEVNPLVVECLTYQKDTTEYCFESVILPTENDKYSLNFKEYKGD